MKFKVKKTPTFTNQCYRTNSTFWILKGHYHEFRQGGFEFRKLEENLDKLPKLDLHCKNFLP